MSVVGPGLFSGEPATLTFVPAAEDAGIMFVREQDEKVAHIQALVANVLKRPRRTCLRNGTLHIETVEHCLAALSGLQIDNATVRITGGHVGELPGGDGSSMPFVDALQEAGIVEQSAQKHPLIIKKPLQVGIGDATLAALPGPTDRLEVIYTYEAGPPIGRQTVSFTLDDDFATQLAPATHLRLRTGSQRATGAWTR